MMQRCAATCAVSAISSANHLFAKKDNTFSIS
jgi:hypothetical protein